MLIPSLIKDHYIKCCQSHHYKQFKEAALSNKNIAMLQIDFAENFTTMWQDEIRSAHWKRN